MYVSINKQLVSFENFFDFLFSALPGKGLKGVSFQMSPRAICCCKLQVEWPYYTLYGTDKHWMSATSVFLGGVDYYQRCCCMHLYLGISSGGLVATGLIVGNNCRN
jgi:hypothetical protein